MRSHRSLASFVLTLSELLESDRTDQVWYNRPIFVQAPERNWPGNVHIRDNGERTMEESEQWRGEEWRRRQRCRRDRDQQRRRPVPRVTDPNIDHDRPLQSEPVLKTSKNLWKTWERTPRSRESELGGRTVREMLPYCMISRRAGNTVTCRGINTAASMSNMVADDRTHYCLLILSDTKPFQWYEEFTPHGGLTMSMTSSTSLHR